MMTKQEFLERELIFKNIQFQNEYAEDNLTVDDAFYKALTQENPLVTFQEILECHPAFFARLTLITLQKIPSSDWQKFWETAEKNINNGEVTAVAIKLLSHFRSDENNIIIRKKALRLLEKFSTETELHEDKIKRDYETIFNAFFEEAATCPEILKLMPPFFKNAYRDGVECKMNHYLLLLRSCEEKHSTELISAICGVLKTDCQYSHDICKVLTVMGRFYSRLKNSHIEHAAVFYEWGLKLWNVYIHTHSLRKVITALYQVRQNRTDDWFYDFFDNGFTVKLLKLALDHNDCKKVPENQKILAEDCLKIFSKLLDTEKDERSPCKDFMTAKEGKHLLTKIVCRAPELLAEVQKTAIKCLEIQKGKTIFKIRMEYLSEEKLVGEYFSKYPNDIKNFIIACRKLGIHFN